MRNAFLVEINVSVENWCVALMQKAGIEFDAVSVGAILSDYQRIRVENV